MPLIDQLMMDGLIDALVYIVIGFLLGAIVTALLAQGSYDKGFGCGMQVGQMDRATRNEKLGQ